MKNVRMILYYAVLILLLFLNYVVIDVLYKACEVEINERRLVTQLVALINAPVNLALGLVRLWILKPVVKRSRVVDASYFVIPVFVIVACLLIHIWEGIILSVAAGGMIVYELSKGVTRQLIANK